MKMYEYYIWQLPSSNKRCFMMVDYDEIDLADYVCVYYMKSDRELNLEVIYEMLNVDHPSDYYARSLSVGDVIFVRHNQDRDVYVVDSFGFKKVKLDQRKTKVF